jgi:hypothetical protein
MIPIPFIERFLNSGTLVGSLSTFFVLFIVYLVFPSARTWFNSLIARQDKEVDNEIEDKKQFRDWLIKRTDRLEEERERRMSEMERENSSLREKIAFIEGQMRGLARVNEELQRRTRTLEWIYLGEICDELLERVRQDKDTIGRRLQGLGETQLAIAVEREFNQIIEDVREGFLIRHLEKTRDLMHELGFEDSAKQSGDRIATHRDASLTPLPPDIVAGLERQRKQTDSGPS